MLNKTEDDAILLMSWQRIRRSTERMAYQIAEDNRAMVNISIIGIKKRGYAVAQLLTEALSPLTEAPVELKQLEINNAASDFNECTPKPTQKSNSYVLLVDDVIFSGHTMFRAMSNVMQSHNPLPLRTAALVDQGHRSVPIDTTFTGLKLPTKLDEHVSVIVNNENLEKVILTNKAK